MGNPGLNDQFMYENAIKKQGENINRQKGINDSRKGLGKPIKGNMGMNEHLDICELM